MPRLFHEVQNAAPAKPDGGTHHRGAAERRGPQKKRIQADQSAERRPQNRRVVAVGARAVARIDLRLHDVRKKAYVAISAPAAVPGIPKRCVFGDPLFAHVVDADDDRLETARCQPFERGFEPPRRAAKRGERIREVLPVVHVDDRVAPARFALVRRRQVHVNLPAVAQLRGPDVERVLTHADNKRVPVVPVFQGS